MRRTATTLVRGAPRARPLLVSSATRAPAFMRFYSSGSSNDNHGVEEKPVVEWTCEEVVRHLRERTTPPINASLLDGFEVQAVNGFALASLRPPTLFHMIKEQVAQGPNAPGIEVSDQLLQDTLLGTATYSVQRRK